MKFCSPRPLNITVFTGDLLDSSFNDSLDQSITFVHKTMPLPMTSYIIEKVSGVSFTDKLESQNQGQQLYRVEMTQIQSKLIRIVKENYSQNCLYKIIKRQHSQQILKNDVIKLGQFELLIKEICLIPPNAKKSVVLSKQIGQQETPYYEQAKNGCRICWQKINSHEDPLVSLCKCSGSIKYTHLSCLREWYQKFIAKEESRVSQYYRYISGNCQLCKQQLPLKFTHNHKEYTIVQIKHPKQPHIILQLLNSLGQVQIICLKFPKNGDKITIGSSQEADLCFDDDSIDLFHAQLIMDGNKILISDNHTAFGTMIKMRQSDSFNSNDGLSMQCGNLNINLSSEKGMFDWMCSPETYQVRLVQKPFSNSSSNNNRRPIIEDYRHNYAAIVPNQRNYYALGYL